MALDISPETEAELRTNAEARGLTVDQLLRELLCMDEEEDPELIAAVEEGFRDIAEGRVYPAREALLELGAKFGFSRRDHWKRED